MNDNYNLIIRSLERLETKADRTQEDMASVKATQEIQAHHLADYNDSLKEHMRRTKLLEDRVDTLEKVSDTEKIRQGFIRRNWKMLATVTGILSAAASAIWSFVQIIGK